MENTCQRPMGPQPMGPQPMGVGIYQGFDPNADYGPLPKYQSDDPKYLELLQAHNTLLKMYRASPSARRIRAEVPRNTIFGAERRIPALQLEYPGVLSNLRRGAERLNVEFNPVDLTRTSEFMDKNSMGQSIEDEYYTLKKQLASSKGKGKSKKCRGKKGTKGAKKAKKQGGRNRSNRNHRRKRTQRT